MARSVGDRETVIAAGSRDDSCARHAPRQQVGERAAWLERARVLEELELAGKLPGIETEVGRVDFDDWRAPHVRLYATVCRRDLFAGDGNSVHAAQLPGPCEKALED
jgi:hypothetical protein